MCPALALWLLAHAGEVGNDCLQAFNSSDSTQYQPGTYTTMPARGDTPIRTATTQPFPPGAEHSGPIMSIIFTTVWKPWFKLQNQSPQANKSLSKRISFLS